MIKTTFVTGCCLLAFCVSAGNIIPSESQQQQMINAYKNQDRLSFYNKNKEFSSYFNTSTEYSDNAIKNAQKMKANIANNVPMLPESSASKAMFDEIMMQFMLEAIKNNGGDIAAMSSMMKLLSEDSPTQKILQNKHLKTYMDSVMANQFDRDEFMKAGGFPEEMLTNFRVMLMSNPDTYYSQSALTDLTMTSSPHRIKLVSNTGTYGSQASNEGETLVPENPFTAGYSMKKVIQMMPEISNYSAHSSITSLGGFNAHTPAESYLEASMIEYSKMK